MTREKTYEKVTKWENTDGNQGYSSFILHFLVNEQRQSFINI